MSANFMIAPPVFSGEHYEIWSLKMKTYLEVSGLWEFVNTEGQSLQADPTVAQIRTFNEEIKMRAKAKACIHSTVSNVVFTRIINCETAKEAWDTLQVSFQGNEQTRQMQVLNPRREFEMLRMKQNETIKEYFDRILMVVNKIRLLQEGLSDKRVVEKVLVSLPERFEAKISSLEDSRDLSQITITELMNTLQTQEQRRLQRLEPSTEGAFMAKEKKEKHSVCQYCKKTSHPHWRCWWRPDVVCRSCNQKGHVEKVCKRKQQEAQIAQETDYKKEEHLFVATCFASDITSET